MRLLIVEDNDLIADALRMSLETAGHTVVGVALYASEAVRLVGERCPELALVNVNLADGYTGVDAAIEMHARYGVPSLFLTSDCLTVRGANHVAIGCLSKPCKLETLYGALRVAEQVLAGQPPAGVPFELVLYRPAGP